MRSEVFSKKAQKGAMRVIYEVIKATKRKKPSGRLRCKHFVMYTLTASLQTKPLGKD